MIAGSVDKLVHSLLRIKQLWRSKADSSGADSSDSVLGLADTEAALRRLREYPEPKPLTDSVGQRP